MTAEVSQMMGYKGDIIIPETIVFNEATYRVTSIEEEAFYSCDKLRTIRYGGTIAQWKEIAHYLPVVFCRIRVVRCTDGDAKL